MWGFVCLFAENLLILTKVFTGVLLKWKVSGFVEVFIFFPEFWPIF